MKKLLFVLGLVISLFANSQGDRMKPLYNFRGLEIADWYLPPTNYVYVNQRYRWFMGMFDSGFHVPTTTVYPTLSAGQWTGAGGLKYRTTDSSFYGYSAYQWTRLASSQSVNQALANCYGLLNGLAVSYLSGLTFDVSPGDFTLGCFNFHSNGGQVTGTAAHATLERIDVVLVDTLGVISILAGTPAADPSKPQVDPSHQLELTFYTVAATATTPTGVSSVNIYLNNAPEWTATQNNWTASVAADFNSTTDPFEGTKHILISNTGTVGPAAELKFVNGSVLNIADYTVLKFYIKPVSNFTIVQGISLRLGNGTAFVSPLVPVRNGDFGFSRGLNSWQLITVPISAFNTTGTQFDRLYIYPISGAKNFYLDVIQLQAGITQPPSGDPSTTNELQTLANTSAATSHTVTLSHSGGSVQLVEGSGVTLTTTGTGLNGIVTIASTGGATPTWQQTLTAGGVLTQDNTVTINTGFELNISGDRVGTGGNDLMSISNSSTGGALNLQNASSFRSTLISRNTSTGPVITSQSDNGGLLYSAITTSAATTGELTVERNERLTTGTATTGIGLKWENTIELNDGTNAGAMDILLALTNVTPATATSAYTIKTLSAGSLDSSFSINGWQLRFNKYGVNTFSGTAAYALGVDASGNVVEFAVGGGGGSGTVNSGAALKAAYYPTAATTVDDWAGVEFNNTNLNTKIIAQASTDVILELRMAASQTADPFVIKNSAGNNVVQIQDDSKTLFTQDATASLQNADGFDNVVQIYGSGNAQFLITSGSAYAETMQLLTHPSGFQGGLGGGNIGMRTNNALNFTTNATVRATITATGNYLWGGTTSAASATKTHHIFNGTAPTGGVTDGVLLYSEDVAASAELKVRDEAGNITVLGPHDFTGIPEGRSEEMAWGFYSERDGKYINVDMLKLARLIEKLTGEKLVYIGDTKQKPNPKNK